MSEILISAIVAGVITMVITIMVIHVELRLDCEKLGQFRLNSVVYTCTPQPSEAAKP